MRLLFLDTETTGLDPTDSKILCIGYSDGNKIEVEHDTEIDSILSFLKLLDEPYDIILIGYNIKGFDIPFITTRAYANAIKPEYIANLLLTYKIDLMRVVRNYMCVGRMRHDLKTVCNLVGVDVENDDIDGSQVPECDDEEKIVKHCKRDVERTIKLFEELRPLCVVYFARKYGFTTSFDRGWME